MQAPFRSKHPYKQSSNMLHCSARSSPTQNRLYPHHEHDARQVAMRRRLLWYRTQRQYNTSRIAADHVYGTRAHPPIKSMAPEPIHKCRLTVFAVSASDATDSFSTGPLGHQIHNEWRPNVGRHQRSVRRHAPNTNRSVRRTQHDVLTVPDTWTASTSFVYNVRARVDYSLPVTQAEKSDPGLHRVHTCTQYLSPLGDAAVLPERLPMRPDPPVTMRCASK